MARIAGAQEPRWQVALSLFAGVHYLELAGVASFSAFREALVEHEAWLVDWVAAQPVQTNEVQRSWGLLPAFLGVAGDRPLDLIELGASGGLNLCWDRHRYRYGDSAWGPDGASLELSGDARGGPPPELFDARVEVRSRLGVDRRPVDVTTEQGARVLEAFVWADQAERLQRLRRAIDVVRAAPPRLVEGDYVEMLPDLLAGREGDGLTVVYHSASAVYLDDDAFGRLRETIVRAGSEGPPLAWISLESRGLYPDFGGHALDVELWPGGVRRRLARVAYHGERLEWLA